MSKTFTALDFETATPQTPNICQVGIVQFINGEIANEINILVQPHNNHYWDRFIEIHGITPEKTKFAAPFNRIWHDIEPYIANQVVVAHNGLSFDFPVLEKTLQHYNISIPKYEKQDTRRIYGGGLADLCEEFQIPLNHHDALSDARACGLLYLKHLNKNN